MTRAVPDALSGVPFSLAYAYHAGDADAWKLFDPAAPVWTNDLTALSPGWGYWVQATISNTWTVAYPAP